MHRDGAGNPWSRVTTAAAGIAVACCVLAAPSSAHAQDAADLGLLDTAEGVVAHLYQLVSFEAGATPDWNEVRSLFLERAVIVLRTSRVTTAVFSVDGFVNDFVTFIERANAALTGFTERVLRIEPTVFGDMANVWVLYEASIPGSDRPPQQGVDNFSLIKKDGRWWIAAVINEIPTPARPIPPQLAE